MEMFISGLVGWLIQEVGGSGVRRMVDPVRRSLEQVVRDAVPRAVAQVYADAERREHTVASLMECPAHPVPRADGVPLTELAAAVRVWVASIEYPIGADGRPERVDDHPLVEPLCSEILDAIRKEATLGRQTLHPIWTEYLQVASQSQLDRHIRNLRADLLNSGFVTTGQPSRPTRIEYWHTPVAHAAGFIGRTEELAWLAGDGELQLIHGIGGVGKTALVVEHARRVVDQFPDGRVFLDFQSYSMESGRNPKSSDQALAELMPQCGVDNRQLAGMNLQQRETAWKQAIAGRHLVFVWDNVGDVEQIRPLLTGQPGCLTLITSRAELDLPGVRTMPLAPLIESDAVTLFQTIAGSGNCANDPDLVPEAVRLCARMPLQIGVHASSVRRKRTLGELVTELRTLPSGERLATLFASLDLSYRDLTQDEQRALRVLGTHPGPHLTAGTAAAMLGCSTTEAVRLLDDLVDANFVDRYRSGFDLYSGGVDIPTEPGFYAYVTHDLLRDYAYEKAARLAAEIPDTLIRLVDYYRERTLQADVQVPAWIQAERACLLAALGLPLPPEAIQGMALDFGGLLAALGWYPDAETAYWVGLSRSWKMRDRAGEAEALTGLSDCAAVRAAFNSARWLRLQALAIYRDLGDQQAVAQALDHLSYSSRSLDDFDTAESHVREALAIYRQLGDRRAEAYTLRSLLGLRVFTKHDDPTLRKELANLARLGRELGDRRLEAGALLDLATLTSQVSAKRAAEGFQEAYNLFTAERHQHGQANALYGLGQTAVTRDDRERATRCLAEAIAIYREIGDVLGEIKSLVSLGDLALTGGDVEQANALFHKAYVICRSTDSGLFQAVVLEKLAQVAIMTGDRAMACSRLRAALDILPANMAPAVRIRELMAQLGCLK